MPSMEENAQEGDDAASVASSGAAGPKKKDPTHCLTKDWARLEDDVMVCPGTISQAHKKLKARNEQGASICVVACAYANMKPMNTWDTKTLDEVIELGSQLHARSRRIPANKCLPHLGPQHVDKHFFLGDVRICMRTGSGGKTVRVIRGMRKGEKSEVERSLERFFNRHTSGIVAFAPPVYFAVWRMDPFLFLFDPQEHDARGDPWQGISSYGVCYAKRYVELRQVAATILGTVNPDLCRKFKVFPCCVEKLVRVNTKPPLSLQEWEANRHGQQTVEVEKLATSKSRPDAAAAAGAGDEAGGKDVIAVKMEPKVPPERPKLDSVTNFKLLQGGRWGILRTITHQNDPKFTKYMGAQGFANAISALTMLRVLKAKLWISTTPYEVLKLGEVIHRDTLNLRPGEELPSVAVEERMFNPIVRKGAGAVGRLTSSDAAILSLEEALRNYFVDYDCGILMGPYVVALWKEDERFYMFDPNERDAGGRQVAEGDVGYACVTWFSDVGDLVRLYLGNVPIDRHKERFVLCKVAIKDAVPRDDGWHSFAALSLSRWILRGTISQNDRRFAPETRNLQGTAIAVVALAFRNIIAEEAWDSDTVDRVVTFGDEYYTDCVEALKAKELYREPQLLVDEVKKVFAVGDKRVNVEVDDCLVNGVLNAKGDVLDLKHGFEEFFEVSEGGIVSTNGQSMAVWMRDDAFFYFDSHSRNHKGIACASGTACLLRLVTLEELTKSLLANLGANAQNLYNISRLIVKVMEVSEEGFVRPPLNNFTAINDYIAILRGSISEKSPKYGLNAGKQTVPMCLVALAFNILSPSFEWSQEDLDQVLDFGNRLYYQSMEANYSEDVPEEMNVDDVTTVNVQRSTTIGQNAIEIEMEECSIGNYEENLREALEGLDAKAAEEGNDAFQSILESQYVIASMWRDDNLFYLFDPRPRDERGLIYGRDDWSLKPVEPEPESVEIQDLVDDEEDEEDEEEEEGVEGYDADKPSVIEKVLTYEEEKREENTASYAEEEEQETWNEEEEDLLSVREKKGSEYWRRMEEEGKSCVVRFSRLDDLIGHLLENTPPCLRQEIEYTLKTVRLTNKALTHMDNEEEEEEDEEWMGDWHRFREIEYGRWRLAGRRSLLDDIFPEVNKGRQQLPMCLLALGFAYLYSTTMFKETTVDDILLYGDRLYTATKKKRGRELKADKESKLTDSQIAEVLTAVDFGLGDYPRKFCVGDNLLTWEVTEDSMSGDITSTLPDEVADLETALDRFFNGGNEEEEEGGGDEDQKSEEEEPPQDRYAVVECRGYAVAMWRCGQVYLMFNPHPTGPSGYRSPIGVATITASIRLKALATVYLRNLSRLGSNFFVVHSFEFEQGRCPRQRVAKEEEQREGKLGGYVPVMLGKAVLRGTLAADVCKFRHGVHLESASVAFAVLGFSLAKSPRTWTRIFVDEIMLVGAELHGETVHRMGDRFDAWTDFLDVYRVRNDFRIGTVRVNCALRYGEQRGVVDVKNKPKVANLRQGFERFFVDSSHGILHVHRLVLGVWEDEAPGEEKFIYLMDPNPRGATGLPSHGGLPCLMRFRNAKVAADHVMACLLDVDKTTLPFAIVPAEVVVGTMRSRARRPRRGPQQPRPLSVPASCPSKMTKKLEKKLLKEWLKLGLIQKAIKKMDMVGRKAMFQMAEGEWVVRGKLCVRPHRHCPVIFVAFVVMSFASDLDLWTSKDVDFIVRVGDQLYVDSCLAYKPDNPRIGLHDTLRRFELFSLEVKLKVLKPLVSEVPFDVDNTLPLLERVFLKENFCVVNYSKYLVGVYFRAGYYYMFDPNPRDMFGNRIKKKKEKGSPVMLKFSDLGVLVEKLVRNLAERREGAGIFALIFLRLESVTPLNLR